MEKPIEVVVSHDILEVPYEDSTKYVWAGTQTFTIVHLSDLGVDTNVCDVPEINLGYLPWYGQLSHLTMGTTSDDVDLEEWRRELIEYNTDSDKLQSEGSESCKDDSSSSVAAESRGRVMCGICDDTFRNEMSMHSHRIGHFGYYRGIGKKKSCFVCGDPFESIKKMSEHLYAHYPGTIKDRAVAAAIDARIQRRKRRASRNREKHSESLKSIDNDSTPPSPGQIELEESCSSPELQHKNYPMTNNDRLTLSDSQSSSSSSNYTVDNCKYNSSNCEPSLECSQSRRSHEFECCVCPMTFSIKEAMHRHRVRHFGYFRVQDSPKCVFCGDIFTNLSCISDHLLQHYTKTWRQKIDEITIDLS